MPKEYFCNKLFNKEICGENDASNFEPGRYSTCKKCRVRINREGKAAKKEEMTAEKVNNLDPDVNIRFIIEETILKVPFIRTSSIVNAIYNNEQDITDILNTVNDNQEAYLKENKLLKDKIKYLEDKLESLENKITNLKI